VGGGTEVTGAACSLLESARSFGPQAESGRAKRGAGDCMTRALLIQKLLETYHLNVPERRQLVPPAIEVSELQAVIRDCVEGGGRFSALEKLEGGRYRVHHWLDHEWAMGCYGPPVDVIDDYADLGSAAQS